MNFLSLLGIIFPRPIFFASAIVFFSLPIFFVCSSSLTSVRTYAQKYVRTHAYFSPCFYCLQITLSVFSTSSHTVFAFISLSLYFALSFHLCLLLIDFFQQLQFASIVNLSTHFSNQSWNNISISRRALQPVCRFNERCSASSHFLFIFQHSYTRRCCQGFYQQLRCNTMYMNVPPLGHLKKNISCTSRPIVCPKNLHLASS